jgi:multiple sugar transport system ATP-binding protein
MDEPLSNLDAKLRVQTRAEIARLHQRLQTTIVYVTHDQVEAMTMGSRIAVMNAGDLLQVGTPQELYDHPRNRFVAGFIGSPSMNFASLQVDGDRMKGSGFDFPIPSRFRSSIGAASSRSVVAGFRPEHLELGGSGERLTIRAKADVVEYLGNEELLHLTVADHDGDVIAVVSASHSVHPGDILDLQIPADKLHVFDAESGDAIPASTAAAAIA